MRVASLVGLGMLLEATSLGSLSSGYDGHDTNARVHIGEYHRVLLNQEGDSYEANEDTKYLPSSAFVLPSRQHLKWFNDRDDGIWKRSAPDQDLLSRTEVTLRGYSGEIQILQRGLSSLDDQIKEQTSVNAKAKIRLSRERFTLTDAERQELITERDLSKAEFGRLERLKTPIVDRLKVLDAITKNARAAMLGRQHTIPEGEDDAGLFDALKRIGEWHRDGVNVPKVIQELGSSFEGIY